MFIQKHNCKITILRYVLSIYIRVCVCVCVCVLMYAWWCMCNWFYLALYTQQPLKKISILQEIMEKSPVIRCVSECVVNYLPHMVVAITIRNWLSNNANIKTFMDNRRRHTNREKAKLTICPASSYMWPFSTEIEQLNNIYRSMWIIAG